MNHPFLPDPGRPLVLASRSPRRADILTAQGLEFTVDPADVDEARVEGEAFDHFVPRLARDKAQAVAPRHPEALVLGCDTVVILRGEVLNKPADKDEAVAMLRRLSGREHTVLSAAALVCWEVDFLAAQFERTRVRFRDLDDAEIDRYVEGGEPMDKAGAYGIQGHGAMLVESLEGSYFNVMGLPLSALREIWLGFCGGDA